MKNCFIKISLFLQLLCAGYLLPAQSISFKVLLEELQTIQKQLVPDKRVAIFEIAFRDTIQKKVVVFGETNLPDAKKQIIQILTYKNISFIDSIRVLPDVAIGEKTWALSTLSVSNLRAKPDDASELVSQTTLGTPLKVLDYKNKWFRVQTPDNYIGWMDAGGLQPFNANEMDDWKNSQRYLFDRISGVVLDKPRKKGNVVSDLVLGDLFEVENTKKRVLKMKFPDGRTGYVRKADCISFEDWSNSQPNVNSIANVAKQMMGFPYLWGGTSSKGVDCSGFTKLVFYTQGIIIARDASQQAKYGEPVDFSNINNLKVGDLIFFGRSAQRVTHVGIYFGNGDFIHASGKVHISSIVPGDPKFAPERNNVAARRILNSIDTEGIVSVKNHPWYINAELPKH
jgi:hypothetical protein